MAFGSRLSFEELKDETIKYLEDNLKESRRLHTLRVADTALMLAGKYGADAAKTEIAALMHDFAKNLDISEMNESVRRYGLDDRYLDNPNLSHSKLAARQIQDMYGVSDSEIINAVSYHTTGREDMSLVEKIVFLADAIEPGRTFPGVDAIRKAAETDLDEACLMMLDSTVRFLKSKGAYLDPDTLKARDYLIKIKEK